MSPAGSPSLAPIRRPTEATDRTHKTAGRSATVPASAPPTPRSPLPATTQRACNPRHLIDEDRMAAAIALVSAIKQLQAAGLNTTEAALHVREIERHTAQLRSAGEDRALAIMTYLIRDIVNTAAMREGTTWEAAWEAAARQARAGIAHIAKEFGEEHENRLDTRLWT